MNILIGLGSDGKLYIFDLLNCFFWKIKKEFLYNLDFPKSRVFQIIIIIIEDAFDAKKFYLSAINLLIQLNPRLVEIFISHIHTN